jgi:hypothetical protein
MVNLYKKLLWWLWVLLPYEKKVAVDVAVVVAATILMNDRTEQLAQRQRVVFANPQDDFGDPLIS